MNNDEVVDCIYHHLPSIYRSDTYEKEGTKVWQCRECVKETDEMNKPVILEHDGIKEIMTTYHVDEVRKHRLEICKKCTHYRCICKFREISENG